MLKLKYKLYIETLFLFCFYTLISCQVKLAMVFYSFALPSLRLLLFGQLVVGLFYFFFRLETRFSALSLCFAYGFSIASYCCAPPSAHHRLV